MKGADKAKGRASVERAMALRDVMSHAVEVEKETRKAGGPPRGSGAGRNIMLTFSLGLLAFTIFAYAAKPEFIFGADPNNVSEVRRDANVRFTLFLASLSVESYKKTAKRYPDDLSALKSIPKSVSYVRISDDVFELRAKEGTKDIIFRSNEPVDRFLGNSPKILSGRGQ
jgi:hypothetical protein